MSWNPFGKSSSSSSTRRSAVGNVFTKSVDRDIERECRKVEQLEETTKKLQKDLKRANDSSHGFAQANLKVMQNLTSSPMYSQDEDFAHNVDECLLAAKDIESAAQSIIAVTNRTAVEPLKKISTVFPVVQAEVRKRREKSEEMEKLQIKVDKLREKERTGPNIVKLDTAEKALDQTKNDFEVLNETLLKDFSEFDQKKAEYFQPSVEALMCAEALFYKDTAQACEKALVNMKYKNVEGEAIYSDPVASQKVIQQKINEIKTLSIVVHR